jgi:hypothetical protein
MHARSFAKQDEFKRDVEKKEERFDAFQDEWLSVYRFMYVHAVAYSSFSSGLAPPSCCNTGKMCNLY